ncbi:MAG: hypothetical protein IJR62_02580 [Lachnospiraceae bacterium]|nr:hypothetical protein [Lachnospiraceae bacterium]
MVFEKDFYVGYSDVDERYELTNKSILRFLQDAACVQSVKIGDSQNTRSMMWFILSYRVDVFRRPIYDDTIRIRTWARHFNGPFAVREFEIVNEAGEVVAKAVSNWGRINGNTRKLQDMDEDIVRKYEPEPDRTNYEGDGWLQKLHVPETNANSRLIYIDRNFIDANHHMNNIFYMDIVSMTMPEWLFRAPQADTFEIMFRRANNYGETVQCHYAEEPDAHVIYINSEDDTQLRTVIRLHRSKREMPY